MSGSERVAEVFHAIYWATGGALFQHLFGWRSLIGIALGATIYHALAAWRDVKRRDDGERTARTILRP